MNLDEIKSAVDNGSVVCCSSDMYEVQKDRNGNYNIVCLFNEYTVGLTWLDKETLNEDESKFYIKEK